MATGTGNLPYNTSTVSPFDVILAATTNEHIANINALADASGIGDQAIKASNIDFATFSVRVTNIYADFRTWGGAVTTGVDINQPGLALPRAIAAGEKVVLIPTKLRWIGVEPSSPTSGSTYTLAIRPNITSAFGGYTLTAVYYYND